MLVLLKGKKLLRFRVSWSMRLKGCLIVGLFVVHGNIWLSGKDMGIMRTSGFGQLTWVMLRKLSLSIRLSPFLGSQGPGGGVVLGSDCILHHFLGIIIICNNSLIQFHIYLLYQCLSSSLTLYMLLHAHVSHSVYVCVLCCAVIVSMSVSVS